MDPIDKYIFEQEADEIGGVLLGFIGPQGSAKTSGLWNKAKIDYEEGRMGLWRAQPSCQWIGLAAQQINGKPLPVTIWIHDSVEDYKFVLTGDKQENIEPEEIDLEEAEGVDVQVKTFSDPENLVENKLEFNRVNVYFIPGLNGGKKERHFFHKIHEELFYSLNNRINWGNHLDYYLDEMDELFTKNPKKPYYYIVDSRYPNEVGNFRKNGISLYGTTHSVSLIHWPLRDKFNGFAYMKGARIDRRDKGELDQQKVNSYKRGDFVINESGYEVDFFQMPDMPHDTIPWMPGNPNIKLKMHFEAEIPDIVEEDDMVDDDVDASIQEVKRDTQVSVARKIYEDDKINVTQKDLARVFNRSQPTINDWVNY